MIFATLSASKFCFICYGLRETWEDWIHNPKLEFRHSFCRNRNLNRNIRYLYFLPYLVAWIILRIKIITLNAEKISELKILKFELIKYGKSNSFKKNFERSVQNWNLTTISGIARALNQNISKYYWTEISARNEILK